jgi:hypothetical protein
MRDEPGPIPDPLRALERRLRSWTPAPGGLSRELMIFEAGMAAASPPRRVGSGRLVGWRLAAAASLLLAMGLGLGWSRERLRARSLELALASPAVRPIDLTALAPVAEVPAPPVDPSSYLALVRRLTIRGDAAEPAGPGPEAHGAAARPATPQPAASARPLRARDLDRLITL